MIANDDMVQGYRDGLSADAVPPGPNRSASYVHGWRNGQDDHHGRPRASAMQLRSDAENAMSLDALAGINTNSNKGADSE